MGDSQSPVIARIAATPKKKFVLSLGAETSGDLQGRGVHGQADGRTRHLEWQFQIGDKVKTGKTQTRLAPLAVRRVKSKIDAALRAANPPAAKQHD
jgi:hypothetical protein